jgi:hypothetical protein
MPEFNVNLKFDLNRVMVFHVLYAMAISKFILRYKARLLYTTNAAIGKLRSLLNDFRYKFPAISELEVESAKEGGNDVTVGIRTSLVSILRYKSITLNFNLEI